jgi:serpin B
MRKYILLLTLSVCVAAANAAAPKRSMLEQGKTWTYIYHHFTDRESPGPNGKLYDEETWFVWYTLEGDTVIDGRQYMTIYKYDQRGTDRKYSGACREDDEGRVYAYNNNEEKMSFDFGIHFSDGHFSNATRVPKTIKVNGQLFCRYRYYDALLDDNIVDLGYSCVEGVGFKDAGLMMNPFAPRPTCICDYMKFYSVSGKDFNFYNSDFDAPKEIELEEGEQELINSNNDFAFNLFRKARGDKSKILSPLSITFALGMLNNSAEGQTLQEINQTLGFGLPSLSPKDSSPQAGEQSADAINAFCQKMLKESNTLDERTKALIANTIFVNEGLGYRLQEGFIDKVNTYYDAQPQNRDFADGETMGVINQWANDHTMGMIPTVLDSQSFDPSAVSYLLNALYFKGIWSSPFKKEETKYEPFGGGDEVPMMHMEKSIRYTENDLYQAIRLPYGNGAYRMDVFLPREDKTVGEVLETLSGSNWQQKYQYTFLDLKLPRFETSTNQPLVQVMADLGMPTAFMEEAEFPYFCNTPCFISDMFQVAKIKLDEEGTEAAAVTVICVVPTSVPPQPVPFHANRPFLYIISEQSTGTIFFIGQYTGGVTADIRSGIVATKAEPKPSANNQLYNLAGQKVNASYKGIVIQNGKKHLCK